MVSLLYQEYEWHYGITVINLGFLGITFGVIKGFVEPRFSRWLSFDTNFLQNNGIKRTMLKD